MEACEREAIVSAYNEMKGAWVMLWRAPDSGEIEISDLKLQALRERVSAVWKEVNDTYGQLEPLLMKNSFPRKSKSKEKVEAIPSHLVTDFINKKSLVIGLLEICSLLKSACDSYQEMESARKTLDELYAQGAPKEKVTRLCVSRQFSSYQGACAEARRVFEQLKELLKTLVESASQPVDRQLLFKTEQMILSFSQRKEFLQQLARVASTSTTVL